VYGFEIVCLSVYVLFVVGARVEVTSRIKREGDSQNRNCKTSFLHRATWRIDDFVIEGDLCMRKDSSF
jgi:hypothetical protein